MASLAPARSPVSCRLVVAAGILVWGFAGTFVRAECPPAGEIMARLEALPLENASRTRLFHVPVPESLYAEAIATPQTPIPARDGKLIQGAMLSYLPTERLWMAINDDDHHAQGGYLPLRHSEVVAGRPGHSGRETVQYYRAVGLGRWWVNRLEANRSLYLDSGSVLWELHWRDVLDKYPEESPPVDARINVPPIEEGWGTWLLISLGGRCTLVEYAASGDPGGLVGALHWMGMTRTLRRSFRGMVGIVEEHLDEPHPRGLFVRPDGTPIEP